MIENVHPVLIKRQGVQYRLLNIAFEKDGSIYVQFPRKKPYVVRKAVAKEYSNNKTSTIKAKELEKEYLIPKVSFHPAKFTVHVKTSSNEYVLDDYQLHNSSPSNDTFVCPMMQVVFPKDITVFDEYTKTKYPHCLYLDGDLITDTLSLFFFIHSQHVIIKKNALDIFVPHRGKDKKVISMVKIASNAKYTCSLAVIDGDFYSNRESVNDNVLVFINTEKQTVTYFFE